MDKYFKKIISILISFKLKIVLKKKINKIFKTVKVKSVSIPDEIIINNLKIWKQIDKNHNGKWLKVYAAINGIIDKEYISEQAFYNVVEPTLNNAIFAEAYSDKNSYSKIIDSEILPKTFLRCIQSVFYDENYNLVNNPELVIDSLRMNRLKIVCKKSIETGGGKDVIIFNRINDKWINENNNQLSLPYLNKLFRGNFIIQEYIIQHRFFYQFNPSSVNTVRIFSYRSVKDNQINLLHSVFRIGKQGSVVDNQASGGISCGINIATGYLNDYAVNKYGNKYTESNGISFKGKNIPEFSVMKEKAINVSMKFPYHRLLGFDFCVDKEGQIKLIEVNNRNNEINFLQMNNGPLFKGYTDEIISCCLSNRKTLKIDFEL